MADQQLLNPPVEPPIDEEIITVGIAKDSTKTKILQKSLIGLSLLLLLISIPGAVYLSKQKQNLQKKAVGECCDHTPCPGGTKDCPSGYQCKQMTDCPGCNNYCVETNEPPGCCSSNSDCATWEKCQANNPACTSGKSCCSTAGCANNSDCCSGLCQGGTCVGAGTLECHAGRNGVSVVNNTSDDLTVDIHWFASWCGGKNPGDCGCAGGGFNENGVFLEKNGGHWGRGMTNEGPPENCAYQSDVQVTGGPGCSNANSGCFDECNVVATPTTPVITGTPTPTTPITPTPTLANQQCLAVTSRDASGGIIDTSKLKPGDQVYLTVSGTSANWQSAIFQINGVSQTTIIKFDDSVGENLFYVIYTIPEGINHIDVTAQICLNNDGTNCN